ncbi:MAG: hypothetical protein JRG76_19215 [Deltaproteobacteria bacterium]|nr:hypothetical protein [Deltaproteobacteria bacterium]
MKKFALSLAALLLAACGPNGGSNESAAGGVEAVSAGGATVAEECLEGVRDGRFAEAIPVCQAALETSPDSDALQDALAEAVEGARGISDAASDALRRNAD